jgi:transcriptional regulator with GAF, ATPase, and Fis domain
VDSGSPVLTVDAQADGRFGAAASVHALRLRSILAVPLRVKGEVVGAVYVDDRLRPGAFGDEALRVVLDVADQAAIAIENARLLAENKRRKREVEALNRRLKGEVDRQRVELRELRKELDDQRAELRTKYSYEAIVARSASMQAVFRVLDRVTDSEVPVVILGDSGTGKELVARAIHYNGSRSNRPFVTENCGAIPETLLESVLFGHVKGAFTGADRSRQGLFEVADGGTLLLDEVSEMSPAMQAKLLRVLQEGELRPVGGDRTVKVNVRVIASSNRDLAELVRGGEFREDLFYRLNVITVRLPPLRERPEDIPLLVEHFIAKHGGDRVKAVARAALKRLSTYEWPGNVRQLENEVMRASVLADDLIREDHLSPEIREAGPASGRLRDDLNLRGHVEELERSLITRALSRFRGNQSRAAEALGLSRFGLQKKMKRLGITARPSGA